MLTRKILKVSGVRDESFALKSVILTQRVHPFPFRTRKLSSAVPKILAWRRAGKIGHCRHKRDTAERKFCCFHFYSSLAQSVEHLTVNQVVAGSSPAGGAKTKGERNALSFCFGSFLLYSNSVNHCLIGCVDRRETLTRSHVFAEQNACVKRASKYLCRRLAEAC